MALRREYRIPSDFISRFIRAAEAGPQETAGLRQFPIWNELAYVLGFDVTTVEPTSPDTPAVFSAEEWAPAPFAVEVTAATRASIADKVLALQATERALTRRYLQ